MTMTMIAMNIKVMVMMIKGRCRLCLLLIACYLLIVDCFEDGGTFRYAVECQVSFYDVSVDSTILSIPCGMFRHSVFRETLRARDGWLWC